MDPLRNIPRLSELSAHLLRLPTPDRGLFSTLTSISDIQAWTTPKADEYRQIALALLAIHNLAAPIHRLPTEVLEQVFSYCWQDWNSLRLPHVCRLWRSIILGWAPFWADAVANCELQEERDISRNELPLIDAFLSRSAQHSHTIRPSFYTFPPSIAALMTPHISTVVSLQVAVGREDLRDGLWPTLVSGMPNLEALVIQVTITEEDLEEYHEEEHSSLATYHCETWDALPMLCHNALPKLSRVTCPHKMIDRFADVSLKRVRLEWMDRSPQGSLDFPPAIPLGKRGGLYLQPHHKRLEVLEIMPGFLEPNGNHGSPLELFSLHYLHITEGSCPSTKRILPRLLLPPTTFIHITGLSSSIFFRDKNAELRSIVDTVDRVFLRRLPLASSNREHAFYDIRCFAGDTERLRMENFSASISRYSNNVPRDLITVFGNRSPVTHLMFSTFSTTESHGRQTTDLYAFPHLVRLDVSGSDMETWAEMLKKMRGKDRFPCPKLAELVMTCECPVPTASTAGARTTPASMPPDTDIGAGVDERFRQGCAAFRQVLADRVAQGTRLTHLTIRVHPTTVPIEPSPDTSARVTAANRGSEESRDSWQQQQVDRKVGRDCSSPEDGPDSSNKTTHQEPAKSDATWPSHAARRSVLQSLQELVDGPVISILLDSAGGEMSIDEAPEVSYGITDEIKMQDVIEHTI